MYLFFYKMSLNHAGKCCCLSPISFFCNALQISARLILAETGEHASTSEVHLDATVDQALEVTDVKKKHPQMIHAQEWEMQPAMVVLVLQLHPQYMYVGVLKIAQEQDVKQRYRPLQIHVNPIPAKMGENVTAMEEQDRGIDADVSKGIKGEIVRYLW